MKKWRVPQKGCTGTRYPTSEGLGAVVELVAGEAKAIAKGMRMPYAPPPKCYLGSGKIRMFRRTV